MLKVIGAERELEGRAAKALRTLLEQVPAIRMKDLQVDAPGENRNIDILAHIDVSERHHSLVCEVKASGQPRHVRMALLELRDRVGRLGMTATPVLIAPYLSAEAQTLCKEQQVGFLDLEGNAHLVFDGVLIDRLVASKPVAERRELKSLFKPKAAQVLRVMLRKPERGWRVIELAEAAAVSVGHVSNVRMALVDREWGRVSADGLSLTEPDALLDAWRAAYEPPAGRRLHFYTILHGGPFEKAIHAAFRAGSVKGQVMLASFSAARWLVPYGRISTEFFYADEAAVETLQDQLKLSTVGGKGGNVVVTIPKDSGLFRDREEPAPGIICTSAVQTYLDLSAAGDRGEEAAGHLRLEKLRWRR